MGFHFLLHCMHACQVASAVSDSVRPHRWQPTRLRCPWDSPGKNTGGGCHFLLQCMKVKSESDVAQSCPTLSDPMDCSLPGSSAHGIFQARVVEWVAIAFTLFLYIVHLRLSYLSLLFFGTLHTDGFIFPFLICLSFLIFSQPFVRPLVNMTTYNLAKALPELTLFLWRSYLWSYFFRIVELNIFSFCLSNPWHFGSFRNCLMESKWCTK